MKKQKWLLIFMLITTLFSSCKQEKEYSIVGLLPDDSYNGSEVILHRFSAQKADTARIENNRFSFSGHADGLILAGITIVKKKQYTSFVLLNDKITIEVSADMIPAKIIYHTSKGAAINDGFKGYYAENDTLFCEKYKEFMAMEVTATNEENERHALHLQDSLIVSYIDLLINRFRTATDREGLSLIVDDLTVLFGTKEYPDKIKELYAFVPEKEKNSTIGRKIQVFFQESDEIALGQRVDFEFVNGNGEKGNLSQFHGKLVLLEFWATWCGPCIAQFPVLGEISQHTDKIQVVTISIDENREAWENKLPSINPLWKNIHYKQAVDLKRKFFINGVPSNYLISPEGKIMRKRIPLNELLMLLQ
jgi:thiol-disulfide isomerase/thioredoxin